MTTIPRLSLLVALVFALVACGPDRGGGNDDDANNNDGDNGTGLEAGDACPETGPCSTDGSLVCINAVRDGSIQQCQPPCDKCDHECQGTQRQGLSRYCNEVTSAPGEGCDTDADCGAPYYCAETNQGFICTMDCDILEPRDVEACPDQFCWPFNDAPKAVCTFEGDPAYGIDEPCETTNDCAPGLECLDVGSNVGTRCYAVCEEEDECPVTRGHRSCTESRSGVNICG